jgi:hypothetical protein
MRIGNNPEKESKEIIIENYHRIVIPVYIPNFEGYFADTFSVFKLCLESLLLTVHSKTRITIYNNNCHIDVRKYIDEKYNETEIIDQVFHSKENLGKINAILAAVKGNLEPLITITDADVFFKKNWQNEVEKIHHHFPEAGMVSPVPSVGNIYGEFMNSTLGFAYLKGKIKRDKVFNRKGVNKFLESIGRDIIPDKDEMNYFIIKNNENYKSVLGCGHFVTTFKASVFENTPNFPSKIKVVGGSEGKYLDGPNDQSGGLKLATIDNYAYHLGNKTEDWMYESFNEILKDNRENIFFRSDFNFKKQNLFIYFIGYVIHLFSKIKKKLGFIKN